ncbi:AMP-binding protein [Desulfomarina sp.]
MDSLRNLTYYDIYEKNALFRGESTAICWNDQDTSHAELFEQTRRLANGLQNLNLPAGSRIGILCKNHPAFFHLFGAASALNLVLVLINRRLNSEEISYIIEDTTPALLICDGEMEEQAKKLKESCSFVDNLFVVDHEPFNNLYEETGIKKTVDCDRNDPYIIIHTAAVMGKPRGAVLSQENIILANQQIIETFNLDSSRTYLNILPLFHIMGVNLGLATLQAGGRNIIMDKFDPGQVVKLVDEQKVNIFGSFPPILSNILEVLEDGETTLPSLESVAGLEAPDTVKKWEKATGSSFWTMYGQTETSGLITFAKYFDKPGSAGKISSLANIRIADDFDTLLPCGSTGEILVRGPLVFQGYWNSDELNAHTFREGWHHTGDLGMTDQEGYLFFKGRKAEKELIKPGGENVFPAEVEKVILEHEAVQEVCVFGVPDPKFGEGIKAVCALHEGQTLTKKDLVSFCAARIAGYKKPRYVEFISELPKAEDGSVDRTAIKTQFG